MNERQRFTRKIVYACVIAALLLPLSWLSQPETTESKGGMLAQMRAANQLSQAQLGEIDPASETIKLATLGMRGVAANVLWTKANNYKKTEDWVGYSAALEQIAKLQPNVVSVWIFLGWNLTHNVSVEFDDFHDRYYWVIRGINYRQEGTKYNRDSPRLLSDIGWTIAQKLGRADEKVQFRRLFREDDDFNGSRPLAQRDNWLVGREWLMKAEQVAARGVAVRGERPVLFHSHPVMCLVNYAEDLEEEGTFGEVAKNAWRKAAASWAELSNRDLPTLSNVFVRLGDKEIYDERSKKAQEELDRLATADLKEKFKAEKLASLTTAERDAYLAPADRRTTQQNELLYAVNDKMTIGHIDLAERVPGENRAAALKAAEEATFADMMSNLINIERDVVYYHYWMLRCQIEPEDSTLEARKLIFEADRAFTAAQLVKASELYDQGMKKWREVLDAYPALLKDASTTDPLVDSINHYRSVLHQLDEKFPKPFVLQDVLEADATFHGLPLPEGEQGSEAPPSGDAAKASP
ncbi:MAG TPA: hypothetical protein VL175_03195 [Pirellulales bacterium]|jgi:hypothetical protein|nr:hypothetical protein [Pirellulales bacterium]